MIFHKTYFIIALLSSILLSSCQPDIKPKHTIEPIPTGSVTSTVNSTATPTSIPTKFLLKTSFVPQAPEKNWDQPWQDTCEEAALLTLYYYYTNQSPNLDKIKTDLLAILNYEQSKGWGHDINLSQIQQILLDMYHLNSTIVSDPTTDQIEAYLASNTPVLTTANGKILYQENKHFSNGGPLYHGLVILGFDKAKSIFTVHDVGTQHGAYFKYSYPVLMDSIHDLPLAGKDSISSGPKSILVVTDSGI